MNIIHVLKKKFNFFMIRESNFHYDYFHITEAYLVIWQFHLSLLNSKVALIYKCIIKMYIKVVKLFLNLFALTIWKNFKKKKKKKLPQRKKLLQNFLVSKTKDVKISQCFKMLKSLLSRKGYKIQKTTENKTRQKNFNKCYFPHEIKMAIQIAQQATVYLWLS